MFNQTRWFNLTPGWKQTLTVDYSQICKKKEEKNTSWEWPLFKLSDDSATAPLVILSVFRSYSEWVVLHFQISRCVFLAGWWRRWWELSVICRAADWKMTFVSISKRQQWSVDCWLLWLLTVWKTRRRRSWLMTDIKRLPVAGYKNTGPFQMMKNITRLHVNSIIVSAQNKAAISPALVKEKRVGTWRELSHFCQKQKPGEISSHEPHVYSQKVKKTVGL